MKNLSLVLKIVAILGAAFCVYAWLDTKGLIKTSMEHLGGLEGDTIVTKSAQVPDLLKKSDKMSKDISVLDAKVKGLDEKVTELNSELEAERAKSIQLSGELSKKNGELRTANTDLEASKKSVAEKDGQIKALRQEILNTKAMISKNSKGEDLKQKVAALESELAAKDAQLAEAAEKLKILDMSEVVEVIEVDPTTGKQVKRKIVKTPYIPSGDIATVLRTKIRGPNVIALNRGTENKVEAGQKLILKREGANVAEAVIDESYPSYSIAIISLDKYIPETIEEGDLLELAAESAPAPSAAAPAPAEAEAPAAADAE